ASAAGAIGASAALFSAGVAALGVAADAVGGGPVMGAIAQIAADLAAAAMSALLGKDPGVPPAFGALMLGAPTVLIGGFPCPNLPNPLDALMHGLKCLGKAVAASKGLGKLLSIIGRCNDPNEPVSTFTGEVYNDYEDYRASNSPLIWLRHYRSGWNEQDGPLGFGHRHFFQRTLTIFRRRVIYETHDQEVVALERLADGSFKPIDGFALTSPDGRHFELRTDRDETLDFELMPTTPASGRLARYRRERLDVYIYYDGHGRLQALTEPNSGSLVDTRFTYDTNNRIEGIQRGERGQAPALVAQYGYGNGCLTEIRNALGGLTRFRYDLARRLVQTTDSRSYRFHWEYHATSGRCVKSYGDDGLLAGEASYAGTQSKFSDPTGGHWHFKHYPDGALSHIVDPLGGITQYIKGDDGRISAQVDPDGQQYRWLYDDTGKHIGRLSPFDEFLPPEDQDPDPPRELDHNGPETPVEWLWGRGHASSTTSMPKLPSAVLASLARPAPLTSSAVYDGLGNVLQRKYAAGQVDTFQYDTEGNEVAHLDTRGNWWQKRIASWNLVGAERTPLGNVTEYGYTHLTECNLVVDAIGNRTEYRRNARQDIVEIVQNGQPYLRYKHTVGGTVLQELDGYDVPLVTYATNDQGLHASSTLASGEQYTYAYDDLGNFTDASSSVHKIEQQYVGRRLIGDWRDGVGIEHDFEQAGVMLSILFDRFQVEYDNHANGVTITTPDGSQHRFWREPDGTLVRENGNGTGEAQIFDDEGRLVSRACWRWHAQGAAPRWVAHYAHDLEGLLLEVLDSERGHVRYTYDADKRLVTQQGPGAAPYEYRYDGAGNLSFTPTHGPVERSQDNLLVHSHIERFEYDDRLRLAKRTRYDGTQTRYVYDSADQLIEVTWSDRAEKWQAGYDGLGRRLWREYGGKRTDFYWDDDRLAAELAPDGPLRLYVYPNEDALVPFMWLDYASKDADPASGIAHYLFTAANGMPARVEDASGQVVWQSEGLDAYGDQKPGATPPPLRLRFAGHFNDEDLGLFYNRFRDYDPALARYLQPDPLGHEGGLNLYGYPANPAVEVDLRGLSGPGGHKKPTSGRGRGKGNGKKKPKKGAQKKKKPLELTAAEEKERKPPHAPDIKKWRKKGNKVEFFADGTVKYTRLKPKPEKSVPYKNGHPQFDKAKPPAVKKTVKIEQEGNHSSDYRDANTKAKLGNTANAHKDQPGEPTTWHHHEDGETMQLVDRDTHKTFTHEGGVAESKK
ncbi:MAG: RHS repeat-associated core domain-containing protein, partial [Polyangiaceae bacterium]